jgi:hypothetical protein
MVSTPDDYGGRVDSRGCDVRELDGEDAKLLFQPHPVDPFRPQSQRVSAEGCEHNPRVAF